MSHLPKGLFVNEKTNNCNKVFENVKEVVQKIMVSNKINGPLH